MRPYKNRIGGKGRDVAQVLCAGASFTLTSTRSTDSCGRDVPAVRLGAGLNRSYRPQIS